MPSLSTFVTPAGTSEISAAAPLHAELPTQSDVIVGRRPAIQSGHPATAEVANAMTHGLGFVLSIAAAAILMRAAAHVDFEQWMAVVIYVATMIAVYAASTASHVVAEPRARHFFRMLDQGCIYLFITGTFTPIAAAFLRTGPWWMLLSAMWLISIAGFLSKVIFNHRVNNSSAAIPLILGWMPLLGGTTMLGLVPIEVRWWVLAGGVCYSVGVLFLISDHRHRYLHALWHLWVIAGTACHFWAILNYTLPAN
jgi:hemolysin III